MADFPFQIVGFDLDGTLFDTSADLADAVNHALGLVGRAPLALKAIRPMIGRGAKYMLEQGLEASGGFDPAEMAHIYPELLTFYEANIARATAPFPGLIAAMDALDAQGATLAIVTNKFERLAVKLVDALGLDHRFACVIGGDTMGPGNSKPSALPIREMIRQCGGGRAAFVGDSIYDILAARIAGIPLDRGQLRLPDAAGRGTGCGCGDRSFRRTDARARKAGIVTGSRRLDRIALWAAIALALVMAFLPHPPHLPIDRFGDKFEHMLAFAVIAVLAARAYPGARLARIGERLSFLGAMVELVQSIPALHRDCDIMDWMADTATVIAVLLAVRAVRRYAESRRAA